MVREVQTEVAVFRELVVTLRERQVEPRVHRVKMELREHRAFRERRVQAVQVALAAQAE